VSFHECDEDFGVRKIPLCNKNICHSVAAAGREENLTTKLDFTAAFDDDI
jgi:hypothetical protein